jgi:hypothetical protein
VQKRDHKVDYRYFHVEIKRKNTMDLLISQRESEFMRASETHLRGETKQKNTTYIVTMGFLISQRKIESMFASCIILRGEDLAHSWASSTEIFKSGVSNRRTV